MRVSVIGGSTVGPELEERAEAVGRTVGERGYTLVCGGLGGVMAAACRGAAAVDGRTVGILPGESPEAANPHVDTAIATGLGHARNALVVMNGDGVIAVDGGNGTLSEMALSLVFDRPVAGIDTHDVDGVTHVSTPAEAVDHVERALGLGGDP